MNKRIFALLCISLCFSLPAFAAPAYTMVKEKSSLKFIAIQNNAPVEGEFKEFTTTIAFDPDKPEDSKISAEITLASLSASYAEMVNNLKLPDWLWIEKFPKAVFNSKKIVRVPMSNNYVVDGDLTLRGKKMPVTLNLQISIPEDKKAIAKGFATLHRTDFEVGQGEWKNDDVIKDEVRVEFRIVAEKK